MKKFCKILSTGVMFALLFVSCDGSQLNTVSPLINQSVAPTNQKDNSVLLNQESKVEICHYANNGKYVSLSISPQGLNGHRHHENDVLNFDKDGDGYPVKNECNINFREDGAWDLDDTDPKITDGSVVCDYTSTIIGHYTDANYQFDFSITKQADVFVGTGYGTGGGFGQFAFNFTIESIANDGSFESSFVVDGQQIEFSGTLNCSDNTMTMNIFGNTVVLDITFVR